MWSKLLGSGRSIIPERIQSGWKNISGQATVLAATLFLSARQAGTKNYIFIVNEKITISERLSRKNKRRKSEKERSKMNKKQLDNKVSKDVEKLAE